MKIQFFDGYDLQSMELDQAFSITWVSVPIVRKGIEIKYISKDLYDFLDIPDWMEVDPTHNRHLEKGMARILMISDKDSNVFIRSSEGLYWERDSDLSEKLIRMLTEAISEGNEYTIVNINPDGFGEGQLELIPPKEAKEILTIIEAFHDIAFA